VVSPEENAAAARSAGVRGITRWLDSVDRQRIDLCDFTHTISAEGIGMNHRATPTAAGRMRYLPTDGYYRTHPLDGERFPCTCEPACPLPCAGACGCLACAMSGIDHRHRAVFSRL
jgi:hypothetical protein